MSKNPGLFKHTALATALASVLLVTGCGGGSGSSSSGGGGLSGTVADGYLENAKVCLDVNQNKACDPDELYATTDENGAYTIVGATTAQADAPVAVEVEPGVTLNHEDGQALDIAEAYVLTAPAGYHQFVSPLTTLVQGRIDANPALTADEAADAVLASMGVEDDGDRLFQDYVAGNDEEIHKVAQVTARVLGNNLATVQQVADAAGENLEEVYDALVRMVVSEVLSELGVIAQAVEDAGDAFDPDTAAEALTEAVSVDVAEDTIADAIAEEEAAADLDATNDASLMQTILDDGVHWLESDEEEGMLEFEYGRVSLGVDGEGTMTISETVYELVEGDWVSAGSEEMIALGPDGWQVLDEFAGYNAELNADGTVHIIKPGIDEVKVSVSSLDVSGMPVSLFLHDDDDQEPWLDAVDPDAVFSDGTMAYRWTFTALQDFYEIGIWDGCEEWDLELAASGNCNSAWAEGSPATLISQLITPPGSGVSNHQTIGENGPSYLQVQFIDDGNGTAGTANYFFCEICNGDEQAAATGEWSLTTVNGVELLMFEAPDAVRDSLWHDDGDTLFYAVHDGYVRIGELEPAGSIEENEDGWTFNAQGMEDVLGNFSLLPR